MKLGLVLSVFTADPAKPLASAGRAAAAGYDAVFASDHLFPPGAPDRPSLEPYTLLAAIGAVNPGLGVGVLVTRAGFRPVGMLAKQAAALDHVTGGRAVLGLGVGDENGRAEHAALGLDYPPFPERLALLEETVLALRALFAGRPWPGGQRIPAAAAGQHAARHNRSASSSPATIRDACAGRAVAPARVLDHDRLTGHQQVDALHHAGRDRRCPGEQGNRQVRD